MLRLENKRRGLAGADYVARLDGRDVATWKVGVNWTGNRRPLQLTIDGESCEIRCGRKHGELVVGADTRARVDREPSSRRAGWTVTIGSELFDLRAGGRREMTLLRDGEQVGRVWASGSLRPTYNAELPDDLPAAVQLFLVWTVRTEWVRRQAAASGAAAGSIGS